MGSVRRTTGMTGAAGEYYVAAELSRRGWLATVTIKNSPGTDVLAQRLETALTVAIQTKTASPGSMFRLSEKDERPARTPHEWYVLVRLKGELERPDFFVVPRDFVSAFLFVGHRTWLAEPGKKGPHRDTKQRNMDGEWISDFKERWELLDLRTEDVTSTHDQWVLKMAGQFGLPEEHPWRSRIKPPKRSTTRAP
jgi:hypothetical protein